MMWSLVSTLSAQADVAQARSVWAGSLGIPAAAACAVGAGVGGTLATLGSDTVQGFAIGAPIGAVVCGTAGTVAGHRIGTTRGVGAVAIATGAAGLAGLALSATTWHLPDDGVKPPTSTVAFNVGLGWSILGAPLVGAAASQVAGRPVAVAVLPNGTGANLVVAGRF